VAARSEAQRNGCGEEDMSLNRFHLLGVFEEIKSILWRKDTKKMQFVVHFGVKIKKNSLLFLLFR
jgi:hypothetical protein